MSDTIAADRQCTLCTHGEYNPAEAQRICVHPNVATKSQVSGRVVGMDADMVRYRNQRMSRDYCGPTGRWWEKKA